MREIEEEIRGEEEACDKAKEKWEKEKDQRRDAAVKEVREILMKNSWGNS